jgi:DNA-binding MarR family transcriptional regulator
VAVTLNDLVASGLARREPDPVDRRRNIITMTNKGATALEHLDAVLDDIQDAVLSPLTPNERKTFVRLLAKLT